MQVCERCGAKRSVRANCKAEMQSNRDEETRTGAREREDGREQGEVGAAGVEVATRHKTVSSGLDNRRYRGAETRSWKDHRNASAAGRKDQPGATAAGTLVVVLEETGAETLAEGTEAGLSEAIAAVCRSSQARRTSASVTVDAETHLSRPACSNRTKYCRPRPCVLRSRRIAVTLAEVTGLSDGT